MCFLKNKRSDYEISIENEIRKHWGITTIYLKRLIRENYDDEKHIGKFAVWIDIELELDWVENITDKYLEPSKIQSKISEIVSIEKTPHKHLSERQQIDFEVLLGEALVCCFENNLKQADENINNAKEFLNKRLQERSKLWTLELCSGVVLLTIIVGLICKYIKSLRVEPWMMSFYWGIIGANISQVQQSLKNNYDAACGFKFHFINILIRTFLGGVLGCIGYILIKSDVLLPKFFNLIEDWNTRFRLIGIIGGMFQGFIPSMLSKIATKNE